ncbi:type IX secretion system plug protein [Dinghuibacter silviterrae]|uniref:Uncharacterized protein DUF5103 n=1 Tax=Dinghuibacter silviterrae TaxID=1539049 RepID=A0A4R8DST5_9BACT|nr:DUF5103 domain-containing protein [Dinghuibacter silviterrae]TDX00936.1 uncharacterized protein DUF5103 [Dinghuibacter silviterrae]
MKAKLLLVLALAPFVRTLAQDDDGGTHVFKPNIRTVQLYAKGSQTTPPVLTLGGGDVLDLSFDDLDGDVKNYSYAFELRNEDWSPTSLNAMEYTRGFTGIQITSYKMSSLATTRYTHYHITLPDANYTPTKGGNYLLKVYQDGDPSNLAFQVRFLVVNNTMPVTAEVQPPFSSDTHANSQKVQFSVGLGNQQLTNPTQEIKVVIVQNWCWAMAKYDIRPTFIRNNSLEYNPEVDAVFPGGREWRWLDNRTFRFRGDRVARVEEGATTNHVYILPDPSRVDLPFIVYTDQNGAYTIVSGDSNNVNYQGDYGWVHFTYAPPGGMPYEGKDLYLYGALTNYDLGDSARLRWDPDRHVYTTAQFLKQGYYDYMYVTKNKDGNISLDETEGNFFETENNYLILVYYRPLGGRFDELVGLGRVNSLAQKNAQQTQ